MFVQVHEQTAKEDQAIMAIWLERQDITVDGTDVGMRGASRLQRLVECMAAFDSVHPWKIAGELLGPIANTTAKIENRAIVLDPAQQAPDDSDLPTETKIARTHRKAEAIHHVWPEDGRFDALPIPVD